MNSDSKIYFLSTGRVGTTFLYKYFNTVYPELRLSHQLRWSRIINIIGNFPVNSKFRNGLILFAYKAFKKDTIPVSTLDPLLSLALFTMLKNNEIPNFKIIHLVRDPRNFVTSFMNWKKQSLSKKILHSIVPFWQPYPKGEGLKFFRWIFMSKFERFCWTWYYKNSLFKQLAGSTDYLLVKIEDLTSNKENIGNISNLIHFLEIEERDFDFQLFSSEPINRSEKERFPLYVNWTERQKDSLKNICGKLMTELGYKI